MARPERQGVEKMEDGSVHRKEQQGTGGGGEQKSAREAGSRRMHPRVATAACLHIGSHTSLGGGGSTSQISQETLGNHENP